MSLSKSQVDKLNIAIGKAFAKCHLNAEDINVIKSCESELVSEIGLTLDQARKVSLWCQMECQRDWAQNIYLPQDQRPLHSPYSTYSHRGYRT